MKEPLAPPNFHSDECSQLTLWEAPSFVFVGLIAVFCVDSSSFCPAFGIIYVKIPLSLGTGFFVDNVTSGYYC